MIMRPVRLRQKVDAGLRQVVSIKTSTGTFVAEGLASHNCDYDWVVFCQLWNVMLNLPQHFPKFCMDLKQYAVTLGNPKLPPKPKDAHNALADARWNKDVHSLLSALKKEPVR